MTQSQVSLLRGNEIRNKGQKSIWDEIIIEKLYKKNTRAENVPKNKKFVVSELKLLSQELDLNLIAGLKKDAIIGLLKNHLADEIEETQAATENQESASRQSEGDDIVTSDAYNESE